MRLLGGLLEALWRLVLLPFKLALALLGTTFRVGVTVGTAPVRVGWAATRRAGWKAVGCFALGLALGLLFAPTSGRQLRAKLADLAAGAGRPADPDLAEKVAFELAHAPRTWHLPQPEVTVLDGRVVLTGVAPHDVARDELERAAAAVPGVAGVQNELALEAG